MFERGPSFTATIFAVYVAGLVTSAIVGQFLSRLLVRHVHAGMTDGEVRNLFISSQIIAVLPTALVAAVIAWGILSLDGGGPSFLRVFFAMGLGTVLTTAISTYALLDLIDSSPRSGTSIAPVAAELRSFLYAPLRFVGLFVSALIIHSSDARRTAPATRGETPWEYKLPPGAKWHD